MDILAKMKDRETQFETLKSAVVERENLMKTASEEIKILTDDMKRVQGEYNVLVEIGRESGVLDEEGKPVEAKIEEAEVVAETK